MNLVEQKLSVLPIGSPVRFTQTNGQIIEGVLSANDKTQSLEVTITAKVILIYSQISGIEENNALGKGITLVSEYEEQPEVSSESISVVKNEEAFTERNTINIKFNYTVDDLKSAFKLMDKAEKNGFNPVLNKVIGASISHDASKFKEAVNSAWKTMEDDGCEEVPEVNLFYAYVCAFAEEYKDASLAFYYGNDIRNAYRAAFHGANENDDTDCYVLAAVFAVLYCKEEDNKFINEAAEVIKFSSEKCKDIGAIQYFVDINPVISLSRLLVEITKYLAIQSNITLTEPNNLRKNVVELKQFYCNTTISETINDYDYEPQVSEAVSVSVPEPVSVPVPEPVSTPEPVSKSCEGRITKYNFFEQKGEITDNDNAVYEYEISGISDVKLKTNMLAISKWDASKPIPVKFIKTRKMGKDYAVDISKVETPVKSSFRPINQNPNILFSTGQYEAAIEIYRKQLDTANWEQSFNQIISCYFALMNKNGDNGYSSEISALIDRMSSRGFKLLKSYDIIQQYYMKIQNYDESLKALNYLIEHCDQDDHNRILNYIFNKSRCYRHHEQYELAVGSLHDWLDIVRRNKMTECYNMRKSTIFVELAELYYELEDYENAEKYANDASDSERKQGVLKKLDKLKEPEEIVEDIDSEDDTEIEESTITLAEAYEEYVDNAGLKALDINDSTVVEKISIFGEKHLYSLLTWLTAVSRIAKKSDLLGDSVLNSELTMLQAIQGIEGLFSYAYQNPLTECEYTSSQVVNLYEVSQNLLPKYSEGLMVSAVLRTLFNHSGVQDFYLDELICIIETLDVSKKYSMLLKLMEEIKKFYNNTGCAIDSFAGYKTSQTTIDSIVSEAQAYRQNVEEKNRLAESYVQLKKLRQLVFIDHSSKLKNCLDIVCENDVSRFSFVRDYITSTFLSNNGKSSLNNISIDKMKIKKYVTDSYDAVVSMMNEEKYHHGKQFKTFVGKREIAFINFLTKVVSCICDWLAAAEHLSNMENAYIIQNYDTVAPQIISMLKELYSESSKSLEENGFDWGTNSISVTANELLAKMEGTYNAKDKKYFFIGFLSGEDVLLDDNYLPELESTFCGWGKMNILSRIENYAAEESTSLEKRLRQIISQDDTKQNFRSARLIMEYAEDTDDTSLKAVITADEMNKCHKLVKHRFETMYEEFADEVELYENKGMISDMNGEKSAILKLTFDWFKITRITGDYGFYVRMLDTLKNKISDNAIEKGQDLLRQYNELYDNPAYDLGIYKDKAYFIALIEDQNYTAAETILNCILSGDTKEVNDYTAEPYGYFSDFISEQQTDYRVVVGAGKNLVDAIAEYSGKKDMEFALQRLTNNARKETKGGADLIMNWPKRRPANQDNLQKLLEKLGFNPISIKSDENNSNLDSYIVYCQKRRGKVTYIHPIPAFGSQTETDGFRVTCLYGKFDCDSLMNNFRMMNSTPKNTLVLLDFALNMEERRRLARKIKEEKSFSKTFIVIDRVILFYLAKHYTADTIAKRMMAVTLPFAYCQPFVEASTQTMPGELFTGREDELTKIESPDGVNLVYGGRQLGKSALLKMAQKNVDRNGNNDRAILLDVQYKNYQEVARLLSQELITREILDESCETDNWDDLARHIKKRLMDENPETRINYLLIMLDEADEFIKTSAENDNPPISAVKNLPAGRFKLVMAGLHNLSRFNREMLHGDSTLIHLSSIVIKQFQRAEAIKLLTSTLAYLGFRFNKNVISNILNKTNFYPGLIQFYCQKLLEAMKNEDYAGYNELNTPFYEISESHFKKVLADSDFKAKVDEKLEASLFTEEKGLSHYHILALILAYLYYEMPSEKKYTIEDILKVAEEYRITRILNLDREKLEELLFEMWDLNVVSKEDTYYRFATEGFRELLGSRKHVEDEMSKYFEENES